MPALSSKAVARQRDRELDTGDGRGAEAAACDLRGQSRQLGGHAAVLSTMSTIALASMPPWSHHAACPGHSGSEPP